jgi:hypothetical protein
MNHYKSYQLRTISADAGSNGGDTGMVGFYDMAYLI